VFKWLALLVLIGFMSPNPCFELVISEVGNTPIFDLLHFIIAFEKTTKNNNLRKLYHKK